MHGYFVDQSLVLSEAQALPNTTSANSQAVYVGNNDNILELKLYAHNTLSVPAGTALEIELEISDDNETFISPVENGHLLLVHHTTSDDPLIYGPGELLCSVGLGRNFVSGWVRLKYTAGGNLSGAALDAFCHTVR